MLYWVGFEHWHAALLILMKRWHSVFIFCAFVVGRVVFLGLHTTTKRSTTKRS
jgi:hypothetical protein